MSPPTTGSEQSACHRCPTKERMHPPRVFITLCILMCSCHGALGFVARAGGSALSASTRRGDRLHVTTAAARTSLRRPASYLKMQQTDEEARKTKLRLRFVVVDFLHPGPWASKYQRKARIRNMTTKRSQAAFCVVHMTCQMTEYCCHTECDGHDRHLPWVLHTPNTGQNRTCLRGPCSIWIGNHPAA